MLVLVNECICHGHDSTHNHLNIPIPGGDAYIANGFRAALAQVRGDGQFVCELFDFPKWNEALQMCWLCCASGVAGALCFTNCDQYAPWRDTRRTDESFRAERAAAGQALPMLMLACIGFRLSCITIDVLHTVDLGVTAHVIANIFWELVRAHAWGESTQALNVKALYEEMRAWYKATRTSSKVQGELTVERIRTQRGWPKLKAKAAALRHLILFAVDLASRHNSGSDHDRRRLGVAQCLAEFYKIMEAEDQFLSPDASNKIKFYGTNCIMMYAQLSQEALTSGLKLWKISPKHHLMLHLCEWQAPILGNPRWYWTYLDEDLVGQLIEVCHKCHPLTMAPTAMFKWSLYCFQNSDFEDMCVVEF